MKLSTLIIAILFVAFAGVHAMSQTPDLSGDWKLSSYQFVNKRAFPIDQMEITLTIDPSMRISGRSGCNSYGGQMTVRTANRLSVGQMTSTDMACEGDAAVFEPLFMRVLENAAKYSLTTGDVLTISDPKTKTFLRFKRLHGHGHPRVFFIDNKHVPCPNAPARKCLSFREDESLEWQTLEAAVIGFKFRPGRFYKIEVRATPVEVENPGEAPYTYQLIRVLRSARTERNLYK